MALIVACAEVLTYELREHEPPVVQSLAVRLQKFHLSIRSLYDELEPQDLETRSRSMRRPPMATPGPPRSLNIPSDFTDPSQSTAERVIRWIVLAGFVVVLAVEAWLLWSAWQQLT